MDLLVKKITTVPKDGEALDVSVELLTSVKHACRNSADSTKAVFYYASMDLKKRNGAVRIRALILIDCLIHRSKQFRDLVCADVKQIAKCMGLLSEQSSAAKAQNSDRYVAPATSYVGELESKGKELIEVWDHLYGDRHPQLRALARYFRETLRLDMPNIMENARLHAERADRSRRHAQNLLLLSKDKILENEWRDAMGEWSTSLARLDECFAILFPRIGDDLESFVVPAAEPVDAEDVAWEGGESDDEDDDREDEEEIVVTREEKRHGGGDYSASGGAPYTLTIKLSTTARDLETADNSVLVQTIRELSRHLARSAVPRLLHWKEVFTGCAALYAAQVADLDRTEAPVRPSASAAPAGGSAGGSVGASSSSSSILGKRAASTNDISSGETADTAVDLRSPGLLKLVASKEVVDRRLAEVLALLHSIRVLLTGKVRELLKDEVI